MRPTFAILLPLIWCTICIIGFEYPGDEYGWWYFGSIAGAWISAFVSFGDVRNALAPVAVVGGIGMAIAGLVLDALQVPVKDWIMFWILSITMFAILALASLDLRHTSLPDVMINGANIAMYLSVLLALTLGLIRRRRAHR